jgi:hypothetical protein
MVTLNDDILDDIITDACDPLLFANVPHPLSKSVLVGFADLPLDGDLPQWADRLSVKVITDENDWATKLKTVVFLFFAFFYRKTLLFFQLTLLHFMGNLRLENAFFQKVCDHLKALADSALEGPVDLVDDETSGLLLSPEVRVVGEGVLHEDQQLGRRPHIAPVDLPGLIAALPREDPRHRRLARPRRTIQGQDLLVLVAKFLVRALELNIPVLVHLSEGHVLFELVSRLIFGHFWQA